MTTDKVQQVVIALQRARMLEWQRLSDIRARMLNAVNDIYIPEKAKAEYQMLADQARFNIMPLVVTAKAQNLSVVGYRPTSANGRSPSSDNSEAWNSIWQSNRMDSRQGGLFRGALTYGASYALSLPGIPNPVITPFSPLRCTAIYEDPINDQWPVYAMTLDRPRDLLNGAYQKTDPLTQQVLGPVKIRIYDAHHVYTLTIAQSNVANESIDMDPKAVKVEWHGSGVCPIVRFADRSDPDGDLLGVVEPLIPIQRQLNQTTFSLLMTQQYSAFRQRWATGMAIEEDENGVPLEPWNAAVSAVWQNESPDGKFGDFAESSPEYYLKSRESALLFVASTAQIPPHNLLVGSGISNISAETLASIEAGHRSDIHEYQGTLGEAIEQLIRLGAHQAGDEEGAGDMSAQVVWKDTTPRSLGQVVDALGKLAAQLSVPVQALWERIPGVTDQDIARWVQMDSQAGVVEELRAMVESMRAEHGEQEEPDGAEPVDNPPPVGA